MAKHTEGLPNDIYAWASGRPTVDVRRNMTADEWDKRKNLVALWEAAPDLLAACKAALASIEYEHDTNNTLICADAVPILEAAIKKAEAQHE